MANVAREEFATVSQRVLREVDRFKREKAGEIRRTVMDYITLQIEYNRRVEAIWDGVIPHLERVTVAGGGGGGVSSGAAGDRGGDGGNGSADDDEDDKNEGGEDFGGGDGTFVSGAGKAGVAAPRPNIIGV